MRIAFCIPGNNFSGFFLENWTNLVKSLKYKNSLAYSVDKDIEWKLFRGYHPIVNKARDILLRQAKEWEPTHYMWIDSDINFTPEDFYKLTSHDTPIVSGLYFMKTRELLSRQPGPNGYEFACHGINNSWLTTRHIQGQQGLIEVKANGMGWMLVQSNVFNNLQDPFYMNDVSEKEYGEDLLFQIRAREAGYESLIDPTIIVGHEKQVVLR
tara:strand:- start:94 stop:726 length:633 start_codon:yes stop_codon:yes gene_type:complete